VCAGCGSGHGGARWQRQNRDGMRTRRQAYLCGNPDMVVATVEALEDIGRPIPMTRREKYVSNQ
jgi:NAD(P)H-flavin reductase